MSKRWRIGKLRLVKRARIGKLKLRETGKR